MLPSDVVRFVVLSEDDVTELQDNFYAIWDDEADALREAKLLSTRTRKAYHVFRLSPHAIYTPPAIKG